MPTSQNLTSPQSRIQSVDLLRGIIMIIMAIDHVRVYTGIPAGSLSPAIFFGRWITHYCAPTFAFFAGTGAFFSYRRTGNRHELVKFLVTRGLLLVVLEMTVIRFFWTFNWDYGNYMLAGVIWMLGWCMILLAPFLRLRPSTIGIIGLTLIFFQQIFHYVPEIFPHAVREPVRTMWGFFYPAGSKNAVLTGKSGLENILGISILYVIIPWIGVMMAGFGFGELLLRDQKTLKQICLCIGLSAIGVFVIAGTLMIFLNPSAEENTPFIFKLLGQQKYPPSQLYLLMTLGPVIALVPWAQKIKGAFPQVLITIGRVPLFYYLLHLLLIHLSALVINLLRSGNIHQDWYTTAPLVAVPADQRWDLPWLYLVWFIDVVILCFACRWYSACKSAHPEKVWLKYL